MPDISKLLDIPKLLEWLKNQSPAFFLAFSLVTAGLLLSPDNLLQRLGLLSLVSQNRFQIGAAFAVSIIFLLAGAVNLFHRQVARSLQARRARKALTATLQGLTSEEKRHLASYLRDGTRTQYFEVTDGVAQGLVQAGIIRQVTAMTDPRMWGFYFAYNMELWAWEHLNANPQLLEPELSEPVEADHH